MSKVTIIQSQTLALILNSQRKRERPVEIPNYLAVTAVMITCNDNLYNFYILYTSSQNYCKCLAHNTQVA